MNRVIDRCPTCDPVEIFLKTLEAKDFKIIKQYLDDYHFKQLYFVMSGDISRISDLKIDGISNPKSNFYTCDCHWSTIEII